MDTIAESIRVTLDWERMITTQGNTQETERYYISVVCDVLEKHGHVITSKASSQSPIDIETNLEKFECKKKNKKNSPFILNDTMIKPDVYYIFMITENKTVLIKKGEDLININTENEKTNKEKALILCSLLMDYTENRVTITYVIDGFFDFISTSVLCGKLSLFDFGQMFKRTFVFGNIKSRPRPNWSIYV